MAIDTHYIPAFSIEDVILDKDLGAPLAGGLVYFEQDNQRGVLKPVYQITGTSPDYTYTQLDNPMTLTSIGTFSDTLGNPVVPYFFPYDGDLQPEYYYVRVTSSDDVPQFDREAVPYIPSQGSSSTSSTTTNELSNPQFSEVIFDTSTASTTFTFGAVSAEVVPIAPNWDLVVTVPTTGSVIVSQETPTGALNELSNPGTFIKITPSGVSTLLLRQRIYGSPNLWGSGYISSSFIAKTFSGSGVVLTMYYSQSNGAVVDQVLASGTLLASGNFKAFPGTKLIPTSTSPDDFEDGYIDIFFDLPATTSVGITSVMLAYTGTAGVDNIVYEQTSFDRQVDQLFHYFQPKINFKPIPSLLVGWDFALNPAQFGTNQTISTTAQYIWDQTIARSFAGTLAATAVGSTGDLVITSSATNQVFYLLQYLSDFNAAKTTFSDLSVNINAYTNTHSGVVARVYLFYAELGGTIPTLPTTIGTINVDGTFTLTAANWVQIEQPEMQSSSGTISAAFTGSDDLGFTGFDATSIFGNSSSLKNFAIVVTFLAPTSGTNLFVSSISCVPGDIPTRPAPQTQDEVLRECQYYYESSYKTPDLVGTAVVENAQMAPMPAINPLAGTASTYIGGFNLPFQTVKRTEPTMSYYSTVTGTVNRINTKIYSADGAGLFTQSNGDVIPSGFWTITVGTQNAVFVPASVSVVITQAASVANRYAAGSAQYHYIADARLGKV